MSHKEVTKSHFKASALDYLRQVETNGESIVITDNGQPTLELRRYQPDKPTLTEAVSHEGGLGPAFKLLGEMPSDFMDDAETCSDFDDLQSDHDPNKR